MVRNRDLAVIWVCTMMAASSYVAGEQITGYSRGASPFDFSLTQYLWVASLSLWGATIAYLHKCNDRRAQFSVSSLVVEWVTAPAAGLLVFWSCETAKIDQLTTSSAVLVAGYMGRRMVSKIAERMTRGEK